MIPISPGNDSPRAVVVHNLFNNWKTIRGEDNNRNCYLSQKVHQQLFPPPRCRRSTHLKRRVALRFPCPYISHRHRDRQRSSRTHPDVFRRRHSHPESSPARGSRSRNLRCRNCSHESGRLPRCTLQHPARGHNPSWRRFRLFEPGAPAGDGGGRTFAELAESN